MKNKNGTQKEATQQNREMFFFFFLIRDNKMKTQ